MRYYFRLSGETPAKKNSRISLRNGMNIPSKRYREWHNKAQAEILSQVADDQIPIFAPIKISVTFTHGDIRRRDSDNGLSSILDLLTDCKILKDDNWQIVRKIEVENEYSHGYPHAEIKIEYIS